MNCLKHLSALTLSGAILLGCPDAIAQYQQRRGSTNPIWTGYTSIQKKESSSTRQNIKKRDYKQKYKKARRVVAEQPETPATPAVVNDPTASPYYISTARIDAQAAGMTNEQLYARGDEYFNKIAFPTDKEYKYGDNPELDANLNTAMLWYWKAADNGYEPAQHDLGYIYMNGYGIESYDYDKARHWFSRSASTGNFDSQMNMGEIYFKGLGVKYNPTKGYEWYMKAAEQEYAPAQYMVGYCYANGEGVFQDFKKAMDYYLLAANQGDIEAAYEVGRFYLSDEIDEPDFQQAAKWLEHAAFFGHYMAECTLADMVMKGRGIAQDYDRALELLKEAARGGNEAAQQRLTRMEETW